MNSIFIVKSGTTQKRYQHDPGHRTAMAAHSWATNRGLRGFVVMQTFCRQKG